MSKIRNITLFKCIIWGVVWAVILCLLALVIKNKTDYNYKDILFLEGIIILAISLLSSIGGNPMGLSLQGLGQNNAQYISNSNLEISKLEEKKIHSNIKTNIKIGISTVSLALAGLMSILISFIL